MYEIFKNVINFKRYNLDDMLKKIDTLWVQGNITEEQKNELVTFAQANANPENSNAPLQKQIEELSKKHIALEETVTALSATVQKIKETVESGVQLFQNQNQHHRKNILHGSLTMESHQ